jgi:hypothetical protein
MRRTVLILVLVSLVVVLAACSTLSNGQFTEPGGDPTWPVSKTGKYVFYYFGTTT